MSNSDSFIDEVTEEVRRDRLFRVFRRYGWIGVAGVLALVGGAAFNEWQKAENRARAEALGDAMFTALETPDPAARQAALASVPATGGDVALLALIAAADATASTDPALRAEALARLKAVASDPTVPPLWRDLAELRLLSVPGGEPDAALRRQGLEALAAPGRPFRPLAQEQVALDLLAAGDGAGALAGFRALAIDPEAPSALRARAGQMIVVLGGDAQN
ncbi:MAG: hypothetical protein Q8K20_19645 [Gemmobacter sp.]|nr:hypothetical protein [Gemmobacter sp.]